MPATVSQRPLESAGEGPARVPRPPRLRPERQITVAHMMLAVLLVALALWLLLNLGWQFVGLACLLLPAFVIAYAVALSAQRRSNQEALLWVLAAAAEKEMPLAPGLEAVADQYGGVYRRQVLAVAQWLKAGRALPEAIDRVPGILPLESSTLIRVGAAAGILPQALREAARDRQSLPTGVNPVLSRLGYLVGMLLCIQAVAAFIVYNVMPKLTVIFRDFGARLPLVTVYAIALANALLESYALPILLMLEFALLLGLTLYVLGRFRLPSSLLPSIFRRRHSVLILRTLAIVIESGQPLMEAVDALARFYPDRTTRRRLARFQACVAHGGDWWACLWRQGLVRRAEAAVLHSAQRTGNLPWALRELAESGQRRLVYRLQAWLQFLLPLAVISMGGLVGLFVASYFLPLVQLIQMLARS